MNKKILCFGELLLRLSPDGKGNWLSENYIPVYIGGSELNVAAALAKWNLPVKYCTALPDNYLSRTIIHDIESKNVDTSSVIFSGNKIGLYFLEQANDLKNAGLIYDRTNSSFAELKHGMIDWNDVLNDVSWLHFSAINPALNEQVANVCKEAIEVADRKNITISIDLNYRSKLWQYGKKPIEIMPYLVEHCDVIMGNIWSANTLLGIALDAHTNNNSSINTYLEHAYSTAINIQQKFPKCKIIANTFRFDKGNGIQYFAALSIKEIQYASMQFCFENIVSKIGSGDCFMAGLIYGINQNYAPQKIVNFAAAAAFSKMQEKSDATNQSAEQIISIIENHV